MRSPRVLVCISWETDGTGHCACDSWMLSDLPGGVGVGSLLIFLFVSSISSCRSSLYILEAIHLSIIYV